MTTTCEPEPNGGETVPDLRGWPCDRCGKSMQFVYTLADVGAYCSAQCRDAASTDVEAEAASERRGA